MYRKKNINQLIPYFLSIDSSLHCSLAGAHDLFLCNKFDYDFDPSSVQNFVHLFLKREGIQKWKNRYRDSSVLNDLLLSFRKWSNIPLRFDCCCIANQSEKIAIFVMYQRQDIFARWEFKMKRKMLKKNLRVCYSCRELTIIPSVRPNIIINEVIKNESILVILVTLFPDSFFKYSFRNWNQHFRHREFYYRNETIKKQ